MTEHQPVTGVRIAGKTLLLDVVFAARSVAGSDLAQAKPKPKPKPKK